MKKYIISDTLQSQINFDYIMTLERYAGGHDDQMMSLFVDSKVIGHWNEGDYQGMVATCVQLKDGRFAIYNDYYGSCSGCDSWEGASDSDVIALCKDLADGAYIFNSLDDVKEFLSDDSDENRDGNFDWFGVCNVAKNLLESINSGEF
jgi:hypothetical protein